MRPIQRAYPQKEQRPHRLLGFVIAIPISALLLMWYNYVWIQWHVSFWQWLGMAVPCALMAKSPFLKVPFGVLCVGAIFGQVASWVGLIVLPFIKL